MPRDIREHVIETYASLRFGMAVIAFGLPFVLVFGFWVVEPGYGMLNSLSAYYHTPMRDIFVGALATVGVCLHVYKGVDSLENIALNVAGVLAVLVALLPVYVPDIILQASPDWLAREPFTQPVLHGALAIVFFMIIAFVCVKCSATTLAALRSEKRRRRYRRFYTIVGILMIVLPVLAAVLTFFTVPRYAIFAAETMALWVFAAFWLTKGREVSKQATVLEEELRIATLFAAAERA